MRETKSKEHETGNLVRVARREQAAIGFDITIKGRHYSAGDSAEVWVRDS